MTITYHAGRRIQGLDADRTATQLPSGSVGGWVELGRATSGGSSNQLTVSSLADKRYYMILSSDVGMAGAAARFFRFNNDSGSNYAYRYSTNGAADGTSTSNTVLNSLNVNDTFPQFQVSYLANRSANEKLLINHGVAQNTAGASNAPKRTEHFGKWANTSNAINRIDYMSAATNFTSGDEMVVLGWDPADTHTNNFWEELGSQTVSGSKFAIDFTPKKYLWVQWVIHNPGAGNSFMRFNDDAGSNYHRRSSVDGAADSSQRRSEMNMFDPADTIFYNQFIINNANDEKLVICNICDHNSAGAENVPIRAEFVWKWANTSDQITRISDYGSATYDGTMKIWGAD